jgi:predicted secreted Zn-dependent protease
VNKSLLIWIALIFGSAALNADQTTISNGVHTTIKTEYYDVSGNSAAELVKQMKSKGPSTPGGRKVFGYTKWFIKWQYNYDTRDSGVGIISPSVTLQITYRFPRRTGEKNAPDPFATEWNRFVTALTSHERGHGTNATTHAEMLYTTLNTRRRFTTRAELDEFVRKEGEKALSEARKWDDDFDKRTEHGVTEGAVLK